MDGKRVAHRIRYIVLAMLSLALIADVWAAVLGVVMTTRSSVPGGLALIAIAAILFAGISWRIRFNWTRLHGTS
ncbi:MAG: hypothetical protein ACR2LX_11065 [Jatrophihabitans sp.]